MMRKGQGNSMVKESLRKDQEGSILFGNRVYVSSLEISKGTRSVFYRLNPTLPFVHTKVPTI